MNLTYETTEKGYTIFRNGQAWIKQESYIPYPGETMKESAQNHIAELQQPTEGEPVDSSLQVALAELAEKQSTDKTEMLLAIAELAETVEGGE